MDNIDKELQNNINDDVYTPESLAWRLIVDDDLKINNSIPHLLASIDLDNEPQPDIFNKFAYEFEILLTIYLEMVFGWYKLLHIMDCEDKNKESEFVLDFNTIKLSDLEEPFKSKFKLIGYNLFINEIDDKNYYDYLKPESYCRVALRDLQSDYGFFEINKNNIDKEKKYHFIINSNFKGKNNLRDIFMLLLINNKGYKINFTSIN